MTKISTNCLATLCGFAAALLLAGGAQADSVTYEISVDTSSLSGQSGYVDFQLNPGGGTWDPASATLFGLATDATLTGQNPLPDPGDSFGALPGVVTLDTDNNNPVNDDTEGVIFGGFFDIFVRLNIPVVSGTATSGNSFFLNVQDTNFNNLFVPSVCDTCSQIPLIEVDLDAATGDPTTFNNSTDLQAVIAATPEPASWLLIGTGFAGIIARRRFRP